MKRSFIIPTLLILLLPVQIINADVQSQNSVLHQHSIEIERCINNGIRKADSLVKTGKPDEALTYYKSSLKSKDSLYNLITNSPMWKYTFRSKCILAGILMGFAGVGLLYAEQLEMTVTVHDHSEYGILLLVAGCISWALGTLYTKYRSSDTEKVCQNAHLLFLCTKPRLSQAGALLLPKDFVSLSITFYTMTKIHFRPYNPNQTVLFPPRIDEDIAEHDPVRMVDALVESLNLESFRKLYKECGRSPYHPRMMLKVILYAYMNNIYSCRKIEKLLHRDIHYIWLAGYEKPDFITINRFRNRVKNEINEVFTQTVLLLSSKGFISLNVEYIDGTKIESKANKYTFVWRKTVERNRERLMKKIHILLGQIDNVIAQENSSESNEEIEFTPVMLTEMAGELRQALEQVPEPSTKEEKTALKKKRKQLKELEEHRDKLQEYDNRLDTLQDRNSYSKTDNDATFMRMKEDAMRNGQTKPGYNLQIGTGNQFITDFALFPNPTDTLTLIPFLQSFSSRYDRLAHTVVADSGYGSEENYRFMSENGMEAYVKYNYFHMEQRPRFKPDPFKAENFYYNEEQDFCICPMGQKMQRIGTRHVKTASGYVSENARYRAIRCEGCPLRCRCFKAKGNRTIELNHRLRKYKQKAKELLCSEEGLKHRGQRCIEPEAVFGQMKNNMNYKRFRHFGKDKVFMDFAFFAIAFNIKKMCAKMTKEGMDWLIRPFYELTVVLFRC